MIFVKIIAAFILLVVVLTDLAKAQPRPAQVVFLNVWRRIRQIRNARLANIIEVQNNEEILRYRNKYQPVISKNVPFPCSRKNTRSYPRPTSVHRLRPGDFDVIGAFGDSLTVGVGLTAKNIREVYVENRGIAPTAGGAKTWREYLTLPNIFKEFNPNLVGYANESSLTTEKQSQLNVAETGAISRNIPHMAKLLIQRMKTHPKIDYQNDWKLISMMIGPNDFCLNVCYENIDEALDNHKRDLINTLRILRDNVPRLFVNIILPPNLKILLEFNNVPLQCHLNHLFVCSCLVGEQFKHLRKKIVKIMEKWQQIEYELVNAPEFDTEDFTVVVQPFSLNFVFPKKPDGRTDYSYMSEDCFHFSQKLAATVANSIWNNMLEPVGRKSTNQTVLFSKFYCPTEDHPYIYTRRNSVFY